LATNVALLHWALLLFERLTFQAAQVVITTNESHRQIALERGRKNPGDVFVVRSGPEHDTFYTATTRSESKKR
jgi:hypothetical protein